MKRLKKILFLALMVAALSCLFCQPAFAISEEEVQAQVDAVGKEAVSGNVLIWFMCAIGFLKVSQKIDSFMASLGVNVGHTGGSMLAEAMIAARGFSGFKSFASNHFAGGRSSHSSHVRANGGGKGGAGQNHAEIDTIPYPQKCRKSAVSGRFFYFRHCGGVGRTAVLPGGFALFNDTL